MSRRHVGLRGLLDKVHKVWRLDTPVSQQLMWKFFMDVAAASSSKMRSTWWDGSPITSFGGQEVLYPCHLGWGLKHVDSMKLVWGTLVVGTFFTRQVRAWPRSCVGSGCLPVALGWWLCCLQLSSICLVSLASCQNNGRLYPCRTHQFVLLSATGMPGTSTNCTPSSCCGACVLIPGWS